jgi:hypothetical protein
MLTKTVEDAERLLRKPSVSKTAFNVFRKEVLEQVCNKHQLHVSPTGKRQKNIPTKSDYIAALLLTVKVQVSSLRPSNLTIITGGR